MAIQTAPVSDHARCTARRVASVAGQSRRAPDQRRCRLSVDSSPPDDPETRQLQALFDLGRSRVSLVRINPAATAADEPTFVLRMPALGS